MWASLDLGTSDLSKPLSVVTNLEGAETLEARVLRG
jgi:hypothetical protein